MSIAPTPAHPAAPTTSAHGRRRGAPMPAPVAARRLRTILAVNAATSTATGVAMALTPHAIDGLLDTGRPGWIRLVGAALVVFGVDVGLLSRAAPDRLRRFSPVVIGADLAWVIATVVALVLGAFAGAGAALVIAVAVAVDVFATLQWVAWRQLRSA